MNRENFDMDGAPLSDEFDENKNKKKKGNKLVVILFFILLILCIVAGYFYIVGNTGDSKGSTNVEKEAPKETTTIETIEPESNNVDPAQSGSTDLTKKISDSSITPVVDDTQTDPLALDISKVQRDKAQDGVVQFITHIVRDNEDLNSIAKLYDLKIQTIISINEIKNVSGIKAGVELQIPDRNGRFYIVKSGDMLSTISNEYCPNLGWKTLQEINGLTDTKLDVGDKIFIPDMSDIIANPTINTATNKFVLPTNGAIIAKYGQFIEDNPYNDDISLNGILFKSSSDITASAKGVVVDIQNLKGKKLVKLSHEGSYETVYGNLGATTLNIGDEVSEGEIVGTLEEGDDVLYFEILQSGIPLDPESFF